MSAREVAAWGFLLALALGAATALRGWFVGTSGQGGGVRPPIAAPGPPPTAAPTGRSLGVYLEELPDGSGLTVDDVVVGSAAAIAGVRSGDVLVAVNGAAVQTPFEVQARLRALRAGEVLELTLLREGAPVGDGGVLRVTEEHFAEGAYELGLARDMIAAAARQLVALRRPDGLWPHYQDPARPSVAVSALVLYALSRAGEDLPPGAGAILEQARAQLVSLRGLDGGLEDPAQLVPHRVYASALLLLALDPERDGEGRRELAEWLARAQVQEEPHGYDPIDPRYGGWSYYDDHRSAALRTDVSTARFALVALDAAGVAKDAPVWHRAGLFLDLVQNHALVSGPHDPAHARERRLRDGGFGFTPTMSKAGEDPAGEDLLVYRSYGSATADGLLALLATRGIDARARADAALTDDPQVNAALRWLARRYALGEVPGFDPDPVGWGGGLLFYYLAALAEGLHRAGVWTVIGEDAQPHTWARELVRRVGDLHGRHGRREFRSESGLMHEDEPTVAAAFALLALAAARDRLALGGGAEVRTEAPPPPLPLEAVAAPPPPADAVARGRALFAARACSSCHQDGTVANGPSLVGVGDVLLARLRTEAGARAYLRAYLRDPSPAPMPPVGPEVDDAALEDLISYLLSRVGDLPVSGDR